MNKKNKKEFASTYERLLHEDPLFEADLNKGYQELVLSELLLALMEEDHITVRKLAAEAGVSPSLIQDLKMGKKDNLTLKSFSHIISALGCDVFITKSGKKQHSLFKLKALGAAEEDLSGQQKRS